MTQHPWPELRWWDSGERQVVEEKIDDLEHGGVLCCPKKKDLYKALSATSEAEVRVAILGQDPYPTAGIATGVAFSVDKGLPKDNWPHTLKIIFQEYCSDLHYPTPSNGDLSPWTGTGGVLLWNAIPSCQSGLPLSNNWEEWSYLTGEIVSRLNTRGGVVFVCLGSVASSYCRDIDLVKNRVIRTSHPSPRGIRSSKSPFTGSRVFSTINAKLVELEKAPVNWRLDDVSSSKSDVQSPDMVRGNVLPNVTGAVLGGLKKQGTSPNIYTSLEF